MCGSYSTTNVLYYYYYVTCVTTSEFLPILLFACYTSQAKKRQLIPIRNVAIHPPEYSLNVSMCLH
ncbi:hypothetical protein NC651_009508 [Populus alba x Populus x berolinensis]|nr:hypothetical protein NC651_009508 [Populus alba x Populus x berolinensis]